MIFPGALTVCKHTLVLHRDIAALAAIYGYLVALDLAYRKNIYCYNGNNSIIDNDWQLTGHRFIGERVSIIYPNGLTAIGTVQKYLPPDGDDEALFHILHDDGDKEDLDIHECFAAMEQYRKNFSTLDSNSPFARHLESKVVSFARLMYFKLSVLMDLSQYLDMEVANGLTRKTLSYQILKAYKNFISVN